MCETLGTPRAAVTDCCDPIVLLFVAEFDHLTRHPVRVEQDGVEVSMTLVDTCGLVSDGSIIISFDSQCFLSCS